VTVDSEKTAIFRVKPDRETGARLVVDRPIASAIFIHILAMEEIP